ncbi:2'-5' RNA ligase family protein [Mariniflexile jejuense]|uniref:2'-5' RNA ligase family protein n=1 Tax=Mariniflexile jejuense TaxID=1173582 RepID=A0ABW3JHP6_9FLAO
MNLKEHYESLYKTSIKQIEADAYDIDTLIDSPSDNRFGITLLIRPSETIKNEIQKFLDILKAIDPNQYYYVNSDIHITVMSIISCYDGFELKSINISEYITLINESIQNVSNLKIEFKGITASTSCIMVQGFMNTEALNDARNNLRIKFKNSTLKQSIDKRYTIQTAHATVLRFKEKIIDKSKFLEIVEKYKNHEFGTFEVKSIELVYNDWYQKAKFVKKLSEFSIKN